MKPQVTTGKKIAKYTTLEILEQNEKGPVYVINNTEDKLEGNVVVNVPKRNGNGYDLIRIPKTFIPIDLTMQAARDQLLSASEFRKTVAKGLIRLVTPEYAALLLRSEDAKQEQQRLQNETAQSRSIISRSVTDEQEYVTDEEEEKSNFKEKAAIKKAAKGPNPKIEQLAADAKEEKWEGSKIVLKLRNTRVLSRHDLSFLSKQFSDKPKVIGYLRTRLQELQQSETAAEQG